MLKCLEIRINLVFIVLLEESETGKNNEVLTFYFPLFKGLFVII